MFVAILLVCNIETEACEVSSHRHLLETEEACYYQLGIGMNYFEDKGYVVPVYRCLQLIEDYEKA
jgi:hypothetical protein